MTPDAASAALPSVDRSAPGEGACLLAALLVGSVAVLLCAVAQSRFEHWFVLPVLLCAGLVGGDAVRWLREQTDPFDPAALVGVLSLHLFFAAPLLHVATDYWLPYITPPADWRPWLGCMASVNVLGLATYRVTRGLLDRSLGAFRPRVEWRLDEKRFALLAALALAGGAALQALVYLRFGGVGGYIQAFSDNSDEFTGLGLTFLVSESVPIVALIAGVAWVSRSQRRGALGIALGLLAAFVALKFAFGGLRGSRGHLVYGLFWAGVVIHQKCCRLPKWLFAAGFALLLPFMFAYGYYKSFGVSALDVLSGERAELTDNAPRGFETVLLGDLARSDVQAFMLYRLSLPEAAAPYSYALGQTYVGAAALLVPRQLVAERPPTKVKAGTELLFGRGAFETDLVSTFAFGLTGEAMLNFGLPGAVLSFVAIAVGVVVAQRWYRGLPADDSRGYVLPLLYSLAFMTLLWDSDVLLFYTIKEGAVPAVLIALSSRRVPCGATAAPEPRA